MDALEAVVRIGAATPRWLRVAPSFEHVRYVSIVEQAAHETFWVECELTGSGRGTLFSGDHCLPSLFPSLDFDKMRDSTQSSFKSVRTCSTAYQTFIDVARSLVWTTYQLKMKTTVGTRLP